MVIGPHRLHLDRFCRPSSLASCFQQVPASAASRSPPGSFPPWDLRGCCSGPSAEYESPNSSRAWLFLNVASSGVISWGRLSWPPSRHTSPLPCFSLCDVCCCLKLSCLLFHCFSRWKLCLDTHPTPPPQNLNRAWHVARALDTCLLDHRITLTDICQTHNCCRKSFHVYSAHVRL